MAPRGFNISVTTAGGSVTIKEKFTITSGSRIASTSESTLNAGEPEEVEVFSVYPNPFSNKAIVSFELLEDGAYTLNLYDEKGALVPLLKQKQAKAGERYTIEVDGSNLAKGIYIVKLESKGAMKGARLVLDR